MTLRITTAALVLASVPVFAQSSGVSRPDSAEITSDDAVQTPKLTPRPSAAIPAPTPATCYVKCMDHMFPTQGRRWRVRL